jgi:uncharacterized protein YeaO (DUF488 family)
MPGKCSPSPSTSIRVKRVYEAPQAEDGTRVLVERLWPRGVSRWRAQIDLWMKEIAPSPELRRWFAHDPAKWDEFQQRYRAELAGHAELVQQLVELSRRGPLTLVYAARDTQHNSAQVLAAYLQQVERRPTHRRGSASSGQSVPRRPR